ncbi:hypothetical protein MLD38_021080 [Melastoma candidum]|uniref:Uncharacterized protein n=1 Tax=Melastoma candidum TaxID=119954 RepID=A0ACB9QID2_9MYRT|nr:hypothetical protein MLD38_021080 [Melastoma candidum]
MAIIKEFYKGFKFISQIFVVKEDEEEMEIGLPTDVKHVAHIGGDGPSGCGPAWMKDFRGAPEFQSSLREAADQSLPPEGTTESTMDGKPTSSRSTDNATREEARRMPKKHRRKKIKSTTSSQSKRSSRTGKSKTEQLEMQSIAIAAAS